jgi:hypothetical protein
MPPARGRRLGSLLIPIPDAATQRRIVAGLDALAAMQAGLRRLQTETDADLSALTPDLPAKAFRGNSALPLPGGHDLPVRTRFLKAENSRYPDLFVAADLTIQDVVRALVRKVG